MGRGVRSLFRRAVRSDPAEQPIEVHGKSPGELLYDACAKVFDLKGAWAAPGRDDRRAKYERAANAFVVSITAALQAQDVAQRLRRG